MSAKLPDKEEEWRPVVGYEGLYEVSSLGRIRSLDREVHYPDGRSPYIRPGRVLSPMQTGDTRNRSQVALRKDGAGKCFLLHRLVWEAFNGPIPDGLVVRHLNDDPNNNRLENLAVGTYADNAQDCVRNGHHKQASQTHCKRGHEFTPENTYVIRTKKPEGSFRRCVTCSKVRWAQRSAETNRQRREKREATK